MSILEKLVLAKLIWLSNTYCMQPLDSFQLILFWW
jgi:hypothetical protein